MQNEPSSDSRGAEITGCHHFAICVGDIDEVRRFYGGILSLEELERPAEIAKKFRSAWYLIGRSELHVVENSDFEPLDSPLGPHIAVTTNDFAALTSAILARGGRFSFGPGEGPDGILRAVIKDPTGNTVEITSAAMR